MSWLSFGQTVGVSVVGLMLFSWLAAKIAGATTQRVVNRTGVSNARLWFMRPGIFLHEALHAVVGRLFGLRITEFSLRPSGDSAAHVSFAYNRRSVVARIGLVASASAPAWGIGAIILVLGKRAWWPGQPWRHLAAITPDWPWVAAWLVVTWLLTFGLALSGRDLRNMLAGLPVLAVLLALLYLGLATWAPAALVAWWQLNRVAGGMAVVVLAVSLVMNRLVALT